METLWRVVQSIKAASDEAGVKIVTGDTKVVNRGAEDRQYRFELLDLDEGSMIAPENPLAVPAGKAVTTAAFVNAPRELFAGGERRIRLRIGDGVDFERTLTYRLLGPGTP